MFYVDWADPFQTTQSKTIQSEVSRIRSQLDVTGEAGDFPLYSLDRHQPFRKYKPISEQDGADGKICTASKFWFPARHVVYHAGLPYGSDYAPQDDIRPLREGY